MEPISPFSLFSLLFQLTNAGPEIETYIKKQELKSYTRTETIELYRSTMPKNIK